MNTFDPVNKPSHYGQGSIEAIEYIQDLLTDEELKGYYRGNVAKYLHRWRYKNGLEDLKKANYYLTKLIQLEERNDQDERQYGLKLEADRTLPCCGGFVLR